MLSLLANIGLSQAKKFKTPLGNVATTIRFSAIPTATVLVLDTTDDSYCSRLLGSVSQLLHTYYTHGADWPTTEYLVKIREQSDITL